METGTILTIDDEEPIRRSIRVYFEDQGFRVLEAEDGRSGLEVFRARHPNVVLVDLRMPGMSGLDVIDALTREAPESPVIVLSGTGVVADAIEAIRRGAWDYVLKPIVDLAELEHVMKIVLERARLREEALRYHARLEEEVALRTRELRESEERFRDLVENLNDVIYVVETDGKISYVSPVSESVAGYHPSEVVGHDFREFFAPLESNRLTEMLSSLLQGKPEQGEFTLIRKSGDLMWARLSGRPVYKGNRVVGVQGILTDITDRRMAEKQVETTAGELAVLNSLGREMGANLSVESALRTAIEHTSQSLDLDVVLIFLKSGEDLVLKRSFLPERVDHPGTDWPIHRIGECLCGQAIREKKGIYSRNIHQDPRCTWEECRQAGLRSFAALPLLSAGEAIGVLGLASYRERDLEQRASFLEAMSNEISIGLKNATLYEKAQADALELQTRLSQIQQAEMDKGKLTLQLQQAQKMEAIGTLAGGIAHDFNNILTPIIMGTEFGLMNVAIENPARPMMEKVLEAGLRAKDLVQQILTFSRQSDLDRAPLKLVPILKETIKLARASLPSTIEIRQDISVAEDYILGNPTQIHQVMMNLFANAGHALRDQGGRLEIILREEFLDDRTAAGIPGLVPDHYLRLTVRDTGHGMDRWTLEQIFDPFFTTKERGEGTGLGLSIVHGIVKSYGGGITADSRLGEGTTFRLFFPLIKKGEEERVEEPSPIPVGTEQILLVDDDPIIADLYRDILKSLGYRVEAQTDPLEALQSFKNDPQKYDLLITDMTMPNMTGDRLAVEAMKTRPGMPVILCTGFSERIQKSQAIALGLRAFVMKPVARGDMARTIRKVLDER